MANDKSQETLERIRLSDEDDRFVSQIGDGIWSQCFFCVYKRNGAVCKAFPDGIPDDILWNRVSHINPFQGDQGIQYKRDPRLSYDPSMPKEDE